MNLRLIVTKVCQRNCKFCSTKQFKDIPKVSTFEGFDEIIITGGEPLLFPRQTFELVNRLYGKAKIFVYTAFFDNPATFHELLRISDGITVTLHTEEDLPLFINRFNENKDFIKQRSVRLNVFDEVKVSKALKSKFRIMRAKYNIQWQQKCPLPHNEQLRLLDPLFEGELK